MRKIEKKLIADIEKIEQIIFSRHRLPEETWERNALLSADRNDLIRLGVSKCCSEIEFFAESLIVNYFCDSHSYKTKKYKLLETCVRDMPFSGKLVVLRQMVKLPRFVKTFLDRLETIKIAVARHLSEMGGNHDCFYGNHSLFDLATFARFYEDSSRVSSLLMRRFVGDHKSHRK